VIKDSFNNQTSFTKETPVKKALCLFVVLAVTGILTAADKPQKEPLKELPKKSAFANSKDQLSYAIGTQIGGSFKMQSMEINLEMLLKGIRDILDDKQPLMTEEEVRTTIMNYQTEMRQKMMEKGTKEGEDFLLKNKAKKDVTTLPDGLQYKVISQGKGVKPKLTDTVSVNYAGTLIDGKEFDSSYKRGQPAKFPLGNVIPGWTEVLQLMTVGSKWQVFIPSKLGYGERGAPSIPPNSTLIFTIELLGIEQPPMGK
jgi:FKBP-type peptidyl-prolyl cis-trans isomerase FklB